MYLDQAMLQVTRKIPNFSAIPEHSSSRELNHGCEVEMTEITKEVLCSPLAEFGCHLPPHKICTTILVVPHI